MKLKSFKSISNNTIDKRSKSTTEIFTLFYHLLFYTFIVSISLVFLVLIVTLDDK